MLKVVRVAPSEIAFLYDSCKRCYFRKVNGLQKPKEAMPQMFWHVDKAMKLRVQDMCEASGIPVKTTCSFEKVVSAPILFEEYGVQLVISGKIDKAVVLTDDTYCIAELKMAEASARNVNKYRPQVHCYEYALRNPADGNVREVSRADLFFLSPHEEAVKCKALGGGRTVFSFTGDVQHVPVDLDRAWFEEEILRKMAQVAGSLELPDADPGCAFCASISSTVRYDAGLARIAERSATEQALRMNV